MLSQMAFAVIGLARDPESAVAPKNLLIWVTEDSVVLATNTLYMSTLLQNDTRRCSKYLYLTHQNLL